MSDTIDGDGDGGWRDNDLLAATGSEESANGIRSTLHDGGRC
jgi:hypothetical protein